jgi:hypothetical protein
MPFPPLYTKTRGLLDLADVGVQYQEPADLIAGAPWIDQTALVNEAIDRANFAGGAVLVSGTLAARPGDVLNTGNVPIIGLGAGPSDWSQAPSCLAAYGDAPNLKDPFIKFGGPSTGREVQLRGIYLKGPLQNPFVTGVFGNVNAYGFNIETAARVDDVKATGFSCAMSTVNDHQVYRNCNFTGCEIAAIDFIERRGLVGNGDMQFDHCYLSANGIASVILADNATAAAVSFVGNGHIGLSPVGFLRYAADPTSNAPVGQVLSGADFGKWSFEYIRYAAFWDRGRNQADWEGLKFHNRGWYGMMAGDYTVPGWPNPDWPAPDSLAIFECGSQAINWSFDFDMPTLAERTTISAENHIFNIKVPDLGLGTQSSATNPLFKVRSFVGDPFGLINIGTGNRASHETVGTWARAESAVQRGDVVRDSGSGVIPWDGTRKPSGIATRSASTGQGLAITTQCYETGVGIRNTSGGTLAAYTLVMPDPVNDGGCIEATSLAASIGWVTASVANGAFGEATIQF